jgi:hypothetical protein
MLPQKQKANHKKKRKSELPKIEGRKVAKAFICSSLLASDLLMHDLRCRPTKRLALPP